MSLITTREGVSELDADARAARRLQEYKSKYLVLHDAVLKTYANEKSLLARGRQLKQVRGDCLRASGAGRVKGCAA